MDGAHPRAGLRQQDHPAQRALYRASSPPADRPGGALIRHSGRLKAHPRIHDTARKALTREAPHLLASRYEIEAVLGRGGMATVYRGTDRVLGRKVAVKVLATHLCPDPQFVERFRREAKAAASVTHPNLVSIFDTGSEGDVHFIVMEYVEGRTLDETLKAEGPLPPLRALEVAEATCAALEASHVAGIVHRDIKPANIMLQPNGHMKVMDFGIAKAADAPSLTNAGFVVGTVAYLSPEQARGLPVDPRSDIYSVGCVLYETLTGVPPLAGETLVDIAHKLATEEPVPPSKLNPSVLAYIDGIVMKALAKSPGDRYQNVVEMSQELQQAQMSLGGVASITGAETVASEGESPPTFVMDGESTATRVLGPSRLKGNRLLLIGGAILLLLAGILAISTMGRRQGTTQVREPPQAPPSIAVQSPPPPPPPPPAQSAPEVAPADSEGPRQLERVLRSIVAARNSGDLSEKAAREVGRELEKSYEKYAEGDVEDAAEAAAEAREELSKYYERGEVSLRVVNSLNEALSRLEAAYGD